MLGPCDTPLRRRLAWCRRAVRPDCGGLHATHKRLRCNTPTPK